MGEAQPPPRRGSQGDGPRVACVRPWRYTRRCGTTAESAWKRPPARSARRTPIAPRPANSAKPVGDDRDLADRVADKLVHARRLSDLRMIKAQDRQALYLKALGFRYHEIAALLSITYTAVNRRITEGRRRLRELEAAHDAADESACQANTRSLA
jgi:DNA-directed RNA polymerase specialized sigma24 family protein